ncbi:MAG: tetratricopeptide repeat protein [Deltaproteobacteria bacterium]|jgi:tetratricopeptide (TPR) repeat protein|nr:tetratricopeptide repeat protein [Deltaproteobacteria bacterium]
MADNTDEIMKREFILSEDPEISRLLDSGDIGGVIVAVREKLEISRAAAGPYGRETLLLMHDMGMCIHLLGNQTGAAGFLASSLEGLDATMGADSAEALAAADSLGEVEAGLGNFARARELHARAMAGRERLFGPTDFRTVTSMMNLGLACSALGLRKEESELFRRAHAASHETLGRIHPRTLKCLTRMGDALAESGDPQGGREALERSYELNREALGPGSQGAMDAADSLAKTLTAAGDHHAACRIVSGALKAAEELYGELHPNTLMFRTHLGIALAAGGELEEARLTLVKATDGCMRSMGPSHTSTINSMRNLLRVMRLKDGPGPVRAAYEELSRILDESTGPDSNVAIDIAEDLGKIMAELGEFERAAELFRRAISHHERILGPGHEKTLENMRFLRSALHSMGDGIGEMEIFSRIMQAVLLNQGIEYPESDGTDGSGCDTDGGLL